MIVAMLTVLAAASAGMAFGYRLTDADPRRLVRLLIGALCAALFAWLTFAVLMIAAHAALLTATTAATIR